MSVQVLVADDDPVCCELLENVLTGLGYEVATARNGREAFDILRLGDHRIVVSDWNMPEMSGLELCRCIRGRHLSAYVYILLITSQGGQKNLVQGLSAGADDFITKPFDPEELQVRMRTAERIISLESRDLVIFSLAKLAESRDPETGAHLERVREYCRILAAEMAGMEDFADIIDADYIRTLYLTSPLHDIGKVGIPDSILLKPGRLTEEEFEIMKRHTIIGSQTLEAAVNSHPSADFLRFASDVACSHHERFDGTGYPYGRSQEDIPLCGRILAVADVYDALTTKRVYKPAFPHEMARTIIEEQTGGAFDPRIVSAFLIREREFWTINRQLSGDGKSPPASHQPPAIPGEVAHDLVSNLNASV
jgi:putative two-component system response regulator